MLKDEIEIKKIDKEYKNEYGLKHKCYIYKITNSVNKKMYIGLTTTSIPLRWKGHLRDSKNKSIKRPLYKDIRKYGVDKFSIECIEECNLEEVREKEKYWIQYYNTFLDKNIGYNCTKGGELGLAIKYDEDLIIQTYRELKTVQKVSEELNISSGTISKILTKNEIKITSASEHQKEKSNSILQYDLDGNLLNIFNGRTEVGQWLIDNNLTKMKKPNDAGCLLRATLAFNKYKYKGYHWEYECDYPEELKNKYIERFQKRRYTPCPKCGANKDPKSIICADCRQKEYKKMMINKNNFHQNISCEKIETNDAHICPICGNEKHKTSKYCTYCTNKNRHLKSFDDLNNKISRTELKTLIRTKSFLEIASIYNVSDNAVKKWCKKYNLPYRKADIIKYSDEEWENEDWNLDNLEQVKTIHKKIKPTREQLKQDLYNLTKEEIIKKYDYADRKNINKLAKEYNLFYDSLIIPKMSPEEWEDEKWKDKDFIEHIKKERIRYYFPTRTELKELVKTLNFVQIGELYNVDSSYVNNWLKYFKLPHYSGDYKKYTDEEWEQEIWNKK